MYRYKAEHKAFYTSFLGVACASALLRTTHAPFLCDTPSYSSPNIPLHRPATSPRPFACFTSHQTILCLSQTSMQPQASRIPHYFPALTKSLSPLHSCCRQYPAKRVQVVRASASRLWWSHSLHTQAGCRLSIFFSYFWLSMYYC